MTVETPLYGQTEWTIKDNVVYSGTNGAVVGYIEGNVVKSFTGSVIPILSNFNNSAESVDLSFITAQSNDIRSGKIGADTNGNPVQGTLPEVSATLSANTVTVPAGIHSRQTLTVPEANAPAISGNIVTVNVGYYGEQKKITVGTAKAAATYTPSTSDQSIAAGTYLSGKQTIKGDANLTAENIKSGVRIFNIEGTFEGTGGGGSGTFDLAKVTEYSPYAPALSAISKIVLSGFGDDYSGANGDYNVTAETQSEADEWKRIYKHTSGEWYFWGEYDDEYGEGYWYVGVAPDSGDMVTWTSEELSDGEYSFENWDSGDSYDVTLDVTKTNYPETPMVLKGVLATGYADGEWSFDTAEKSFAGFEETPAKNYVYAVDNANNMLVGSPVAYIDIFPGASALFALDASRGTTELVNGGTPSLIGSGTVLQNGEFCFDNTRAFTYTIGSTMGALKDFTIELDFTITSDATGMQGMFGNRTGWLSNFIALEWGRDGYRVSLHWNGYVDGLCGGSYHDDWINDGKYHHAALVRKGSKVSIYTDGELTASSSYNANALNLAVESLLDVGIQRANNVYFPGRIKHFRVLPFALYTKDFKLANWVGK